MLPRSPYPKCWRCSATPMASRDPPRTTGFSSRGPARSASTNSLSVGSPASSSTSHSPSSRSTGASSSTAGSDLPPSPPPTVSTRSPQRLRSASRGPVARPTGPITISAACPVSGRALTDGRGPAPCSFSPGKPTLSLAVQVNPDQRSLSLGPTGSAPDMSSPIAYSAAFRPNRSSPACALPRDIVRRNRPPAEAHQAAPAYSFGGQSRSTLPPRDNAARGAFSPAPAQFVEASLSAPVSTEMWISSPDRAKL